MGGWVRKLILAEVLSERIGFSIVLRFGSFHVLCNKKELHNRETARIAYYIMHSVLRVKVYVYYLCKLKHAL